MIQYPSSPEHVCTLLVAVAAVAIFLAAAAAAAATASAAECDFPCPSNGRCLPASRVCDGRADCHGQGGDGDGDGDGRGLDERDCHRWECAEGMVKCDDGRQCVRRDRICDGHRVGEVAGGGEFRWGLVACSC